MKEGYDKESQTYALKPETALEAMEQLEDFLKTDMWFNMEEWNNIDDMIEYLNKHFEICKNQIKEIEQNQGENK